MPWVPKSAAEQAEGIDASKNTGAAKVGAKGVKSDGDGGKGGKESAEKSTREAKKGGKEGTKSGKEGGKGGKEGGKCGKYTHSESGKGSKDAGKNGKGIAKGPGDQRGFGSDPEWKGGKKGSGKTKSKDIEFEDPGGRREVKGKGGGRESKGKGKCKAEEYNDGKGRLEKPERTNRSEDARRQVLVEKGKHTEVKKHSSMGCAVVTMTDQRIRQAILNALGTETTISGIKVKLKPHFDKETDQEVHTDLFVGWGRQVEKATPLPEKDLVNHFDQLTDQLASTGRLDEIARAGAQNISRPPTAPSASVVPQAAMQQPPVPGGVAPPPPPTTAMPQQTAYQQYAQAQAHWAAQQQYAQYLMMYQQQQQQQAYAYQQHLAAMANQASMHPRTPQQGGREYKAAYRRPTDDEVKSRLQRIQAVGQAAGTTAAPTTPAVAPAAAASAAPTSTAVAPAPVASTANA